MGNAADAANFFIESPTLPLLVQSSFDNPADFLFDISSNTVRDSKVKHIAAVAVSQWRV